MAAREPLSELLVPLSLDVLTVSDDRALLFPTGMSRSFYNSFGDPWPRCEQG
jgi:hypothetical protein